MRLQICDGQSWERGRPARNDTNSTDCGRDARAPREIGNQEYE